MVLKFSPRRGKRRERRDRRDRRLRNKEFGRCEAKPRAGQTPACPLPQDTYPALGVVRKGLFKKARQLVGKLIEKLYSYSKNVSNIAALLIFPFIWSKIIVNRSVFNVKKTFNLSVKHSFRQTFDSENETPRLSFQPIFKRNAISWVYHACQKSRRISIRAFQISIQLFKKILNFSKLPSIAVQLVKRINYQRDNFPVLASSQEGGMDLDDFEAANERVEEILRNEAPLNRNGGHVHSDTAKKFFDKIESLRRRGFSFIQLCGAFEKAGILPENSNPYSLRQAFLREAARRAKAEELLAEVKKGGETDAAVSANATPPVRTADTAKQENGGTAAKNESGEERVRRLTGTVVDTGLGKIVKHSDGSFEYN
jgi:hypothetical protein